MKGRVSVDLVTNYRVPHHVPLIASIGANLTLSKYFPFFRVMAALDENLSEKSAMVHLNLAMMTTVDRSSRGKSQETEMVLMLSDYYARGGEDLVHSSE